MLRVDNLKSKYFEQINLNVDKNQIVAIIGDNGCGKSTLAKTIAGYYEPSDGSVMPSRNKIGLLTQNPFIQFVGTSIFDELTYSFEQSGYTQKQIEQLLSKPEFSLERKLHTLSGGQAQTLLIIKELMLDKEVLILDETLSNLDEENKRLLIKRLKNSNKAIILITNNLNDTQYAERIYKLENKHLTQVTHKVVKPNIKVNSDKRMFMYGNYEFKSGLNLITGASASGKTTLINDICFNTDYDISLIPQYPFEIITNLKIENIDSELIASLYLNDSILTSDLIELSTGELVKVLLLEALMTKNEILIIDEAIEVLDIKSQHKVIKLMLEKFKTVIIITHNTYLFNDYAVNLVEVK